MLKTIIITSCTAEKKFNSGLKNSGLSELTAADFFNHNIGKLDDLKKAGFECSAIDMYTGRQYGPYRNGELGPIKKAISHLNFLNAAFDHFIVSAGYGIVKSTDMIVPYDVSFNHSAEYFRDETDNHCRNFKQWGDFLQIRSTFESLIADYDLIIVLLASKYTEVLKLDKKSLNLSDNQRVLYFDSPDKLQKASNQFAIIDPLQFNNNKYASRGSAFNFTIRGHLLLHLVLIYEKYLRNNYQSFFDYLYQSSSDKLIGDLNYYPYP